MSRQNQYAVTVNVDGQDLGIVSWDKLTGGEIDSEETKYRPGAMAPMVSLGGSVEVGNVTVSVLYYLDKFSTRLTASPDNDGIHWLIGRAGKGVCVVSRQPLDTDGNAYGKPLVYRGTLKTITPPEVDSESSDAAVLEIEVTPAGTVA